MLMINADQHPLMRRLHRPKSNLPADRQDKRSVIPLKADDWNLWLRGGVQAAQSLYRLPGVEQFVIERLV